MGVWVRAVIEEEKLTLGSVPVICPPGRSERNLSRSQQGMKMEDILISDLTHVR